MSLLSINKSYAEQYEKRKRAEELTILKEKYGEVPSEEDSSTSEEEDEEGEDDTIEKSKDFLRTLSLLKKKDPRIYDKDTDFYKSTEQDSASQPKVVEHTQQPLYLKDYERERLLEKGEMAGISDDDSENEDTVGIPSGRGSSTITTDKMSYDEEQRKIRDSFKQAASDFIAESSDSVLTVRHKTDQEKQQEEVEYIKWLKGHETELLTDEMKDMDALRRYWTDPNLDPDEAFLRDYVLNKRWIDQDSKRLLRYDEIIADNPDPSDDEEEIDKQDEFEEKFNFRYEEPGGTKIVSYPRQVSASLRKPDERRKEKRKEREERKIKEKEQKKEEMRRLKNLKKQEILEKLEQIKKITGNPVVGFKEEDFEADFDPAHHDNMMKKQFNDNYYDEEEEAAEKPQFSDLSDNEEDWDNWVPTGEEEVIPHCEDPDFNMDADYDCPDMEEDSSSSKRKRRRQNTFSKAVKRKKPSYNPEGDETFDDYFNEYYKLDYEDVIGGDLPCRFHYRQTVPNNFGLSTEEILLSEDKELNKWASLKKAVQYRTEAEEKVDVKKFVKKAKDVNKKKRVLVTMTKKDYDDDEDDNGGGGVSSSRPVAGSQKDRKKGGSKRKGTVNRQSLGAVKGGVSKSRLSAYGISTKKMNRKRTNRRKKKS